MSEASPKDGQSIEHVVGTRYVANISNLHPDKPIPDRWSQTVHVVLAADYERLHALVLRFMGCRYPEGSGWKVASGAKAGDSLSKVYLDAKKYLGLANASPALICPKCGANRYKEPCRGNGIDCPMVGRTGLQPEVPCD